MTIEDKENLEPEFEENTTPDVGVEEESHLDDGDVGEEIEEVEEVGAGEDVTSEGETETKDSDWEPDYTYRLNGEEYEMDDRIRALIKDPDTNELVRELVEKADGIEAVKEQRQYLRDQVSQLAQTEQQRQQVVNQMSEMVQKGDIRSFAKAWGITPEQIRELALEDARIAELPAHEQDAYRRNLQAQEQTWSLQQQNQALQQQYNQVAVQQREMELQNVLNHDRYGYAAQAFDERAGRPGAFREEIIKRGQYYAQVHRKDVPPNQLAEELLQYVGEPQVQTQTQNQRQGGQGKRVVQRQEKPTMPQVRGGSGSPVKGKVKSIADIRKLADQFATG